MRPLWEPPPQLAGATNVESSRCSLRLLKHKYEKVRANVGRLSINTTHFRKSPGTFAGTRKRFSFMFFYIYRKLCGSQIYTFRTGFTSFCPSGFLCCLLACFFSFAPPLFVIRRGRFLSWQASIWDISSSPTLLDPIFIIQASNIQSILKFWKDAV